MSDLTKGFVGSFQDLRVWQKAMDLVVLSYRLSKALPTTETYGLAAQARRAAVSVPANIAEGYGRSHRGDYLHHLSVANGSLKELETHLLLAIRLKYLAADEAKSAFGLTSEVGRMLSQLIRKLRARES